MKEDNVSESISENRCDLELFKSNVCHRLKSLGDKNFIVEVLKSDIISVYYSRRWYAEAFYMLAMLDYLSRINDVPLCDKYHDMRTQKLQDVIYPAGILMLDFVFKTDKYRKESLEYAIPEFMRFNIVEADIRDVV